MHCEAHWFRLITAQYWLWLRLGVIFIIYTQILEQLNDKSAHRNVHDRSKHTMGRNGLEWGFLEGSEFIGVYPMWFWMEIRGIQQGAATETETLGTMFGSAVGFPLWREAPCTTIAGLWHANSNAVVKLSHMGTAAHLEKSPAQPPLGCYIVHIFSRIKFTTIWSPLRENCNSQLS